MYACVCIFSCVFFTLCCFGVINDIYLTRDKKRKTVLYMGSFFLLSSPPSLLSRERERERDNYYYHIHCHQWYQSTIKFDKDQSVYSRVTLLGNRREGPTAVCWSATNELHNLILSNHLSCSYHQWESHHANNVNNVLCQQQCVTNNGLSMSLCDERPIVELVHKGKHCVMLLACIFLNSTFQIYSFLRSA